MLLKFKRTCGEVSGDAAGNISDPWFKHLDMVDLPGIFDHGSSCCGLLELCLLSYSTF